MPPAFPEPDATRRELLRQYEAAVDEYRFQVELNWRRSEYFFVLNVGVLIAGATMLSSDQVPRLLVACVFAAGALLAFMSLFANATQHGYYSSARDLKGKLERELSLDDIALSTTPGQGSAIRRIGRVQTFLTTMLIAIGVVDLAGIGMIADEQWWQGDSTVPVAVLVEMDSALAGKRSAPIVVTKERAVVLTAKVGAAKNPLIRLRPDTYRIWRGSSCSRRVVVSGAPFQVAKLRC